MVALQELQSHSHPCLCILSPGLCFSLKERLTQGWLPALAQIVLVGHGPGRWGFLSKGQTWTFCSCSVVCCLGVWHPAVTGIFPWTEAGAGA